MIARYFMPAADERREAQARYAVELLFEGAGLPCRRTHDAARADLIYAPELPAGARADALWIRAEPSGDWDEASAEVGRLGNVPCLYRNARPEAGDGSGRVVAADLIFSTYALATGALERAQPRDDWGVPLFAGSFLERGGLLGVPAVALYSNLIADRLRRLRGGAFEPVPRWPAGKRYCVVMSHDVDTPFTRKAPRYFLRRARTNLARRAGARAYDDLVLWYLTVRDGLRDPLPPERDPNFRLRDWIEFERTIPTASCFYVAVVTSADREGAEYDVTYDFRCRAMRDALRRAVSEGFEVGLHASINAKDDPARFRAQKLALEDALGGHAVRGLRHHYWALDTDAPERTLRAHAEAGFEYDTSFGINDATGFRRGMAWPFRPFDRARREAVPLLEVPPTLMDGAIFYREVAAGEGGRLIREHFAQVSACGGAAVLDWHAEQMNPDRLNGAGPALVSVLTELAADTDIYWASPAQLAEWWRERRALLDEKANAGAEVEAVR